MHSDEYKILSDRLENIEDAIEQLARDNAAHQTATERRFLIVLLAIAALLIVVFPVLTDPLKNGIVTAVLGWIGLILFKAEKK